MNNRNAVPATVSIDIQRTFNPQTREFSASVDLTALQTLTGQYKYNVILTEDGIVWSQNGSLGGPDYIHDWTVRAMMNGALGEEVVNGTWNENETITMNMDYTIPIPTGGAPDIIFDSCYVVVMVYKVGSPLSSGAEIQQAAKWTLIVPDYVATISPMSPDVIADNTTPVSYDVVIHNIGLQTDKYDLSLDATGPAEWSYQFTTDNGTFQMGETDSVEVASGDSTTVTIDVNPNGYDGASATTLTFASRIYPGNSGSATMNNATTTGFDLLVIDAEEANYEEYLTNSLDNVFEGTYAVVQRSALQASGIDFSHFQLMTWSAGTTFPAFYPEEVDAIESYLDLGGNLFITGQDIGSDIFEPTGMSQFAQTFYNEYLNASYVGNAANFFLMKGVEDDPITDSVQFVVGTIYDKSLEKIAPNDSNTAAVILTYMNGPDCGGIRSWKGSNRIVYLGVGFEQIPTEEARDTILTRSIRWFAGNPVVGNKEPAPKPYSFRLEQNYPNPFNPTTKISYTLAKSGSVKLTVHDVLGREIAVLVNGDENAGGHTVEFNASNLSSGIYFYQLKADGFSSVKKMMLVK